MAINRIFEADTQSRRASTSHFEGVPLNPNDLLRLASLLKIQGETVRLFSKTNKSGNGEVSRITALAIQIESISAELSAIARQLGASEASETSE